MLMTVLGAAFHRFATCCPFCGWFRERRGGRRPVQSVQGKVGLAAGGVVIAGRQAFARLVGQSRWRRPRSRRTSDGKPIVYLSECKEDCDTYEKVSRSGRCCDMLADIAEGFFLLRQLQLQPHARFASFQEMDTTSFPPQRRDAPVYSVLLSMKRKNSKGPSKVGFRRWERSRNEACLPDVKIAPSPRRASIILAATWMTTLVPSHPPPHPIPLVAIHINPHQGFVE